MFYKIYKSIINYLLPKRCFSCTELIQDDNGFCGNCWKDLNFINNPFCIRCGKEFELKIKGVSECVSCLAKRPIFDKSRSIFKFDEYSKTIVHAFKYFDKTILADYFAEMLFLRYKDDLKIADFIIPVPMHRFKRLLRMYNPPQVIAKSLSKKLDIPVIPDVLEKTKWTKAQTTLSRKARLSNINGSISITNIDKVKDKIIILIDDVITTGSTVNHCSKILKKGGAKEVIVLSIALVN